MRLATSFASSWMPRVDLGGLVIQLKLPML
jgi:hypothetical protein